MAVDTASLPCAAGFNGSLPLYVMHVLTHV